MCVYWKWYFHPRFISSLHILTIPKWIAIITIFNSLSCFYILFWQKTRGSQEPVITHLVFNLTSKVETENGPPKDHFNSNFWAKDFDVILSHNIPKWNKLAEKIHRKTQNMLNYYTFTLFLQYKLTVIDLLISPEVNYFPETISLSTILHVHISHFILNLFKFSCYGCWICLILLVKHIFVAYFITL